MSTKDKALKYIKWVPILIDAALAVVKLLKVIPTEYNYIFWFVVIILFLFFIYFFVKDIKANRTIPSPKNNKIGVLVSIHSEYDEALTFFQKSFFSEFKKTAEEENDIEIITLPRKLIGKIKFSEDIHDKKSIKLAHKLEEKRILLFLEFNIKMDGIRDNRNHQFELHETLVHIGIPESLHKVIKQQLINLSNPIKKIAFLEEKNIDDLEGYNLILNLTTKYLVAISLLLYGDIGKSKKLFSLIIKNNELRRNRHKELSKYLYNKTLYNYLAILDIEYIKKFGRKNIIEYLNDYRVADEILCKMRIYEDKMEATLKNSFYSHLARHKFIGLFYNKTNLDPQNKDYCEIKKINERISHGDLTRRINKVFFSSIENKGCSSIFNQLTKIFKQTSIDNCNIQFIIEFIEITLDYYSDKIGLYYLLAEYYSFVGDQKLANENFEVFISKCDNERDLLFSKERLLICNKQTKY